MQAGSSTFFIKVTDAAESSQQASYTLAAAPAAPVAIDHSVSLAAGQSVTIDMTEGATGGPLSGAQLLAQPDSHLGTAKIVHSGENYQLQFTAAAQASGSAALRYVLNGPAGTTAASLILLSITGRPAPTRNADVIGMVSAQLRADQNMWASAWQQQKAFQNERPKSPALPSLPFSDNREMQRL